jgi:hypothetical protein
VSDDADIQSSEVLFTNIILITMYIVLPEIPIQPASHQVIIIIIIIIIVKSSFDRDNNYCMSLRHSKNSRLRNYAILSSDDAIDTSIS